MQTGIKTARRNVKSFRYVDDTTLMAETKEELKSLLMKVKQESEEVGLKLCIRKTDGILSHHFMANRWENSGNGGRLFFFFFFLFWAGGGGSSKITEDSDYSHEIKRCLLLLDSIKQDQRLTVAQIMKSVLPNSDLN